jgi:hypothetical protein
MVLEKDEEDRFYYTCANEVLQRVEQEGYVLRIVKRRNGNWIGHILLSNCPLKEVIEGKNRRDENTRKKT